MYLVCMLCKVVTVVHLCMDLSCNGDEYSYISLTNYCVKSSHRCISVYGTLWSKVFL